MPSSAVRPSPCMSWQCTTRNVRRRVLRTREQSRSRLPRLYRDIHFADGCVGPGDRVPLDHCELDEYDAPVKVRGKQVIDAVRFLRLRHREMVLVHANGVNLPKACEDNRVPYRIVKGLYLQVDSALISSSRNCVAVKRAHLGRLKKAVGERIVSATSTRGASRR